MESSPVSHSSERNPAESPQTLAAAASVNRSALCALREQPMEDRGLPSDAEDRQLQDPALPSQEQGKKAELRSSR